MRLLEDGFLKGYCKYSELTEVPSIFSLWGGIATIAATLGRDCHIDVGHFTVYPNLYTVFVAGSARCHKSTAVGRAEKIMRRVEPAMNLTAQKSTPEALIQALSESPASINGTLMTPRSEGVVIISELSTLVDKNSFQNGMISLLTELWDSPGEFEYRTRGRGKETLRNCCLNVLGASTANWLKEAIPVVAIGGGFTSRIIFVFAQNPEQLVAFPQLTEEQKVLDKHIIHDINVIAKLQGAFHLTPAAKRLYEADYMEFHNNSEMLEDKNLSGYAGRRHTIMLKLGMCISASERDTMMVTEQDLQIAVRMLESVELTLPKVMHAITSESQGEVCEEVFQFIKRRKIVKRAHVMSKFASRLTSRELAVIIETLREMRVIAIDGTSESPMIVYTERKLKVR